ncbi:MAG: site-2 protease family protein [Planctomycetes bacterium]|nr:site-2 protease family protein [Planctomycetota bacterium]
MPNLRKSWTLFKIFGFPIKINPTWFLLFFLIVFSLSSKEGMLRSFLGGQIENTWVYWVLGVIGALGLFASLIIHELCHSIVARKTGMPVKGITLFIFGGVSEMEDEPPTPMGEFLMAVVGPVASILISLGCLAVWITGKLFYWPGTVTVLLGYLAGINFALAVFNSLPAFPLDGGRVLRSLIWGATNDLRKATRIAGRIGGTFGMVMIVGGVLMLFSGSIIGGIWFMFIGFFLRKAASNSLQQVVMRQTIGGQPVSDFMTSDPITVTSDIPVQNFVEDYALHYHFHVFPVVDDDGNLIGEVNSRAPAQLERARWDSATVSEIMEDPPDDMCISPDTDASRALSILRREEGNRLIVVQNNEPVGILSLRDLLDFIVLRNGDVAQNLRAG